MTYLLDANVFIQAKNLHYGLDFCPAFWNWILEKNLAGMVFSIDKVADEIEAGADELTEWAESEAKGIFHPTDSPVISQLGLVSNWVKSQDFESSAVNTFFQVADYYLIGHALARNSVIVTHEVPSNSRKNIKIPNVCAGLGISFLNPFEMLRRERANFVLGVR
ncbi:DUF4411 family protein [Leptospira bandrabouensis]|uniref:DUF4411 family protein n=1 Tax=Leptospira bandrabouensis TaxID=2484903 RepID=UPI00223CB6F8|nr:DUF4411 family protein [Leptospira bandrabouensis]MCW7458566.1 DUF4411 family protein [Leptospira bandrabouensis]MCW7478687.1 DUF4411 family protein [Leptospira bandrabouensis]MCW7486649.1 DUF4411 family protein [Leptospira bandrabouensis]